MNEILKYKKLMLSGFILGIILFTGFRSDSVQMNQTEFRLPAPPAKMKWRAGNNPMKRYETLFSYLEEQKIPLEEVQHLFLDPRVEFYDNIAINLNKPPTMDNYSSVMFHAEGKSYDIKEFINSFGNQLAHAEKVYGVDREAIVAVLFVETKLGNIIGKHSVFNILSSLALADSPESLGKIENYINENYHYLDFDRRRNLIELYKERAVRKAEFARTEFASLLILHIESHIDVLELPGSYAGAFGYPQFMPSNVQRYGIDGDGDGRVDLYSYPDAIMSVGNFLSRKGWSEDNSKQRRALLRYNNSRRYV
ncbi:MAG: lytic murein transglycosylase, partial [Candidatus Marinimicrobia bacterium]|nr:lytic murein transglycosylase [Candidatus Neomarinimicrobiota bacterium]